MLCAYVQVECPPSLSVSSLPPVPVGDSLTSSLLLSMQKATNVIPKAVRKYSENKTPSKARCTGESSVRKIGDKHGGVVHVRKVLFEKKTDLHNIAVDMARQCCSKQCTFNCTATAIQRERINTQKCSNKELQEKLVATIKAFMNSQVTHALTHSFTHSLSSVSVFVHSFLCV
jgi:hypothetical protein